MCTGISFIDAGGRMFFGRNLDWTVGYGERVVVVLSRARVPAAFERLREAKDPLAAHAVIGMGIVEAGVPLYFDCGNDAGLAVAGLNFPQSAAYADEPVRDRENVAAYEFPFWVARHFGSVAEVRAALSGVTVVGVPASPRLPVAHLHWLIADARESIVVECLGDAGVPGAPHVWDDDVRVLTNEPDFGWQRTNLRNYLLLTSDEPTGATWGAASLAPFGSGAGMQGIPGDYTGPSRFVKAAFVNSRYPAQQTEAANVTRAFRTLGAVAVPEGCAQMPDGSFEKTLYTSCFSAASLTYYHATYDDPQIRAYPLDAFDLTGSDIIDRV